MIGRIVGGVLGGVMGSGKGKKNHPIAGAVIGAGAMFAARRLLPQRYAFLAATAAAGYLTKKWAERAEQRLAAEAAHAADGDIVDAGAVDSYAGIDAPAPDGQTIGDALPPAIPLDADGHVAVVH